MTRDTFVKIAKNFSPGEIVYLYGTDGDGSIMPYGAEVDGRFSWDNDDYIQIYDGDCKLYYYIPYEAISYVKTTAKNK